MMSAIGNCARQSPCLSTDAEGTACEILSKGLKSFDWYGVELIRSSAYSKLMGGVSFGFNSFSDGDIGAVSAGLSGSQMTNDDD